MDVDEVLHVKVLVYGEGSGELMQALSSESVAMTPGATATKPTTPRDRVDAHCASPRLGGPFRKGLV